MKRVLATALLTLTFSSFAHAHVHLQRSTPADRSVVSASPQKIEMAFSQAVRMTALTLQKAGEESQPLTGWPKESAQLISVPLQALTPGEYVVSWRALGQDNHLMNGTFRFTIAAKAAATH